MRRAQRLVRRGRRQAERLMLDRCRIRPVIGDTTDPVTGVVTPVYGDPVYEGRCKIQSQRPWPSNPDAGEREWALVPTELHLPVAGTADVTTGHYVQITSSVDAGNVGREFRIRTGDRKTLQTAVRYLVEEVTN